MRRRDLLLKMATAAALVVAAWAAQAQVPGKVYRVASVGTECEVTLLLAAAGTPWAQQPLHPLELVLLRALADAGGVDGRNVAYERHCWQTRAALDAIAAELARRPPDAAVAWGTVTTRALKAALRVPIVFIGSGDPVFDGLVESLARPGGNATGVSHQMGELVGKRAQFARELLPEGRTVAILYLRIEEDMLFPASVPRPWPLERLGFEVRMVPVDGWEDIEAALIAMRQQRPDLLLVPSTARMHIHARRLFRLATAERLPTSCTLGLWFELGCLMIYSASYDEQARLAGRMLGKVLRGADPATMPVEQGTRFELLLNLRTAEAIGFTIPPALLARADRVIE